ncbi:hypothetical protein DRO32_00550, partial [Candidatus Bathyarchaeota archaeon]
IIPLAFGPRRPRPHPLFPRLMDLAHRLGGILTVSAVMDELGLSSWEAEKLLEAARRRKLAKRVRYGLITLYDFPEARENLPEEEKVVLEAMLMNPLGLPEEGLARLTGLGPLELDRALSVLKRRGVVAYHPDSGEYKLVAVSGRPRGPRRHARHGRRRRGPRSRPRPRPRRP